MYKKKRNNHQKGKMSHEIIDIIQITGLRNFDNYQKLKSIEIPIDSNKIVDYLLNYKRYKYRFIAKNLLFSSRITNKTEIIFKSCDGLNDAKESLIN